MERGNISLYADVDTYWQMLNGSRSQWSRLMSSLVVKLLLLLSQVWSPMFQCGELLITLSNLCFVEPCPSRRNTTSLVWILVSRLAHPSTVWVNLFVDMIFCTWGYTHSFPAIMNPQQRHDLCCCIKTLQWGSLPFFLIILSNIMYIMLHFLFVNWKLSIVPAGWLHQ